MIGTFLSLNNGESEVIISRSRFIGKVFYIESEEEALSVLKGLKKEFSDARHICFGFVADPEGNVVRFSDAGEPSGTAGAPIIDAIKKRNYRRVLVAVIRYFGGIKLGAGGLTRAYSQCAALAVDNAKQIRFVLCNIYRLKCDFSLSQKILKNIGGQGKVLETQYSDLAEIKCAAPASFDFIKLLESLSEGKIQPEFLSADYVDFV